MFPTLIDFGTYDLPILGETTLALPTYGLLFAISVICAWYWFTKRARSLGVAEEPLFNLTFYSLVASILGAKLLLVLLHFSDYAANPRLLLGTLRSAGVLLGGVILGGVTFILYARHKKLPVFELADALVAPIALAQAIGRLGCFCAGCCWGVPADPLGFIKVTFTNLVARQQTGVPLNVPLVPTQLIQFCSDLLLSLLLAWLWRRRVRPVGTITLYYFLLYSLTRGTIEFWRGDLARGIYFGGLISTSQILSAVGVIVSGTLLLYRRGSKRSAPRS
jgi:phosphatidylglycerol:prolipoprotein diacylglycerol transferase